MSWQRGGQVVEVELGLAGTVVGLDEEAAVWDTGENTVECRC